MPLSDENLSYSRQNFVISQRQICGV